MSVSAVARSAVCVPVRNERAALPALLAAMRAQQGHPLAALCLLFDGCSDGSEEVARACAHGLPLVTGVLPAASPNAGRARRAAMALGLEALGPDRTALLLTTDADSAPAPDWIARAAASLGDCDVVAGRIVRDGVQPAQDRLEAYYDRLYAYRRAVDPVPWEQGPGHHYTGGANLGFRAAAYRLLGGFGELPVGEDATLVDEAGRAGLRVRRDPAVVVHTSARRQGRAAGGLAAALERLDRLGEAGLTVGDPTAVAWQYRRHAAARAAFARLPDGAAGLGFLLGISTDHVVGVARDCPNAEAFAMRIVPAAPNAGAVVALAEAERTLASLEEALLECAA